MKYAIKNQFLYTAGWIIFSVGPVCSINGWVAPSEYFEHYLLGTLIGTILGFVFILLSFALESKEASK